MQIIYLKKGEYPKHIKNTGKKKPQNKTTTTKNPTIHLKNGWKTEWIDFQRKHKDDQQVNEKMHKITNYQGNGNQNHKEILHHTSQNGYHENNKK